ncbi:MAG: class II aldolase/adducin family protein [Clostridia bacterium]|nr:class II aldolase/adducin family protein [Clostridia bacterium]
MMTAFEIKKAICEVGHKLYDHGFVAANDGNISVKVSDNEYYCTPTGVSKGDLTPDMIIKIDGTGKKLEGKLNPSSEIKMHLRVYRERPDVNAVVHAHPPVATAFTVAGIPLDQYILPEAILTMGAVPTCEYGTPSTMEIPDSLAPYIQDNDAFLLKNHGALTVGNTLKKAFFLMEEVEFNAQICKHARELGNVEEIPCDQLEKLMELRKKMQIPGRHPGCKKCKNLGTENCRCKHNAESKSTCSCGTSAASADEDLVAAITKKVLAALGR